MKWRTKGALRRRAACGAAGACLVGALLVPALAAAAGPPRIPAAWSAKVTGTSAQLKAEVDPEGTDTTYRFEYLTEARFAADGGSFAGAAVVPPSGEADAGPGLTPTVVVQAIAGLAPETSYRYRIIAQSAAGDVEAGGTGLTFTTYPLGGAPLLADGRRWEMVSPVEKNGGGVAGPGQIASGGVIQAAADGESITYGSTAAFGEAPLGAPAGSQYIARRSSSGWSSQNITLPTVSGSYGSEPDGVPYQLFSPDLSRALILNGERCRGPAGGECPIANPPLPGSGAPAGYQDYYLRETATGLSTALVSDANSGLGLAAENFPLSLAGAAPDLAHAVLETCAALTPGAFEEKAGEGCDSAHPNLYEWSGGALAQVNPTESEVTPSPPARLAAQSGAISTDGRRVYFEDPETGRLFLRESGRSVVPVAGTQGEAAAFQTASADGSLAFFTEGETLYRYSAVAGAAVQVAVGVKGVLGAAEDGSAVFYQDASGLQRWREGTATEIATGTEAAESSDYPPTTGTARVGGDGAYLLFDSKADLTGYDATDQGTGLPDTEVFLWSAAGGGAGTLTCVSCNPTNERPLGPSEIPGAEANGSPALAATGQIVTDAYKPRALSTDGRRVFFESADALVPQDIDERPDAYEWEAYGEGSCTRPAGCVNLIGGGRSPQGSTFVDASADGSDAFFVTDASLVGTDPGSTDLYDTREGGGFPEPSKPTACVADACQTIPPEPEDPLPGTLAPGSGQAPLHLTTVHQKQKKKHRKKKNAHKRKHGTKKHSQRPIGGNR